MLVWAQSAGLNELAASASTTPHGQFVQDALVARQHDTCFEPGHSESRHEREICAYFPQGREALSSEGQKKRFTEVRAWALRRIELDSSFEHRVLDDDSHYLNNSGGTTPDGQFCLCWCEQKMVSQFIQDSLHE